MPRGRTTSDPKTELVAMRLAPRHVRLLQKLARQRGVSVAAVVRELLDKEARRLER